MAAIRFGASVAEITSTYSSFVEWLKLTVGIVNITPKHLKLKAKFKPDVKSHTAVLIFKPRGQQKLKKPHPLSFVILFMSNFLCEYMHPTKINSPVIMLLISALVSIWCNQYCLHI